MALASVVFLFGYCCLAALEFNINCIALYDLFKEGNAIAYVVCIIFQIIVIFILWAHISCMTEDPGALPQYHKSIREHKLNESAFKYYQAIQGKLEEDKTDTVVEEQKQIVKEQENNKENDELKKHLLSNDIEENQELDEATIKRLKGIFTNFCFKCNSLKPPRAHHCSTCGRCIARMDHHCPWMNNCIGIRNIKLFLVLLAYLAIGTSFTLIVDFFCLFHCFSEKCDVFKFEGMMLHLN